MNMRRITGRDRRGSGAKVYPSIASFYSAGIKLHFDSARGVTSSASRVSQWNDQSGNGNHLVQGTGANQPLLVATATPAGTPAIRTDDTARQMAKLSLTTTQANARLTLFLVVKVAADAATRLWYHGNAGGTAGTVYAPTGGNRVLNNLGSTALTDGAHDQAKYEVLAWRLAASGGYGTAIDTNELYVNGVLQTTPTGTPNLTQGTDTLILGQTGSSGLVDYVELAEAPDTLLSATDVVALSKGLMRKHGIS